MCAPKCNSAAVVYHTYAVDRQHWWLRGAKEVRLHQCLQALSTCAAYIEHMHMRMRRQQRPCTCHIFRDCTINKRPQHMRCDPMPVDSLKSVHSGQMCTMLHSILERKASNVVICSSPNVVSTVCDIQNCYYCGYQRLAGYSLHCVRSWVYSVRQRARAAAEPLIWTGHFASLRCWVSSSVE